MSKEEQIHPPKTKLTFNVGFTGHRNLPNADTDILIKQVDSVLNKIKTVAEEVQLNNQGLFLEGSAELRVLSMLAEGADRLFTQCGLGLGYHFQCALPMKREKYETDFETVESKEAFSRLLAKAESVLKIEECTEVRSRAYQDCGHVILGQSDILVAIWDGKDSGKVGGTSDLIAFAMQHDIPIIWIDSSVGHPIKYMYGDKVESNWESELEAEVKDLLIPWGNNDENKELYKKYINENIEKGSHAKLYDRFTNFILLQFKKSPYSEDETRDDFYQKNYYRYYYATDRLAMIYRDLYRSCGILRQLLPFLASLGLALGFYGVLFGGPQNLSPAQTSMFNTISNIGFLLQALCFIMIIVLSKIENTFRWHKKFSDYRELSELIRQMEYLAPLGIVIKGVRAPAFNKDVNISWVNAQVRAIVRQAGLPDTTIDSRYLREHTAILNDKIVKGQIDYHKGNAYKMDTLSKRLEKFGLTIYFIGIFIVALRFCEHTLITSSILTGLNPIEKNYISNVFNMLSMVIPLFSALAFAVSSQEGFDRIKNMSKSMSVNLTCLNYMIAKEDSINFNTYKNLSQHCADIMLSEFGDWNSFIKSKNISIH
jgi:hypothetical protein